MKTLYLLRHAKSSWDDASLADFDRPLNGRGERTAPFMGQLMADKRLIPDAVISSPARRAKDTALLAKSNAGFAAEIEYDERIYEASPQTLLQVVSELDDTYNSALLIGHNPGMEGFVRFLTGRIEPMPTAALAIIRLDVANWNETSDGSGTLERVFRAKDEMKASVV
jgi:phosphohistidine phosphatase